MRVIPHASSSLALATKPRYMDIENFDLKGKSQDELARQLIESPLWTSDAKGLVSSAYDLALKLHKEDLHKGKPYINHLLRVANRIFSYLHIHDAEVIAAALLHDSVEDHPKEINPDAISTKFSPEVSKLVATVTNAPSEGKKLSYEEKLVKYASKVEQATSTTDGWIIKFSDWCDNGLGIIHGEEERSLERVEHFQRKYGNSVLNTFERRFLEEDIQARLDPLAKNYVKQQLALGHERLS